MEIWKDVIGYEGRYQVSNLGRVKSLSRVILKCGKYPSISKDKIMKCRANSNGYLIVTLGKKTMLIHKLVAIAFLNHTPCGYTLVVNHKNFIRTDNRVENLEVVTQRENGNQKHMKSTSDFVGVFWNKQTNKWQADIHINGRKKYLGSSDCELEASELYQKALEDLANGVEFEFKNGTRSSKYKGVSWNKNSKKWIARISVDGYRKYVGSFDTEDEAFKNCQKVLEEYKIAVI